MSEPKNHGYKTLKHLTRTQKSAERKDTKEERTATFSESLDGDREFFIEGIKIAIKPLMDDIHERLAELSDIATQTHKYLQHTNQKIYENKMKIDDLKRTGRKFTEEMRHLSQDDDNILAP